MDGFLTVYLNHASTVHCILVALNKELLVTRGSQKMKKQETLCFLLTLAFSYSPQGNSSSHHNDPVNKWSTPYLSESKQQNTPSPAAHVRAASYVRYEQTTPVEERDNLVRILLFGGWQAVDRYEEDRQPRGTWIYTPTENSWFRIPLKVQPSDRFGHSLTTLCGNAVVLYGGFMNGRLREDVFEDDFRLGVLPPPVSELWIFDGLQEVWQELHPDNPPSPRAFHSATSIGSGAATTDSCSDCLCQHSIFVFGGLTKEDKSKDLIALDDLVELQCRGNSTEIRRQVPVCRWIHHERQSDCPHKRFFHFAASLDNQTILMFGGEVDTGNNKFHSEKTLWSLNVSSGSWNQKNFSTPEISQSDNEGAEGRISGFEVFSDAVKERILLIRKGKIYSYNEDRNNWIQEKVLIGSSAPVEMRDFAAITVNETILVFSGTEPHTSFLSTRVWNAEMINGTWIWQLRASPRINPPLQALASWTVIGDCLIFAAKASHEWAIFLRQSWNKFMRIMIETTELLKSGKNKTDLADFSSNIKTLVGHFNRLRIGLNATIDSVWHMDLKKYTWWQYSTSTNNRPLFYTASDGIVQNESRVLVTYGGSSVLEFRNLTVSSGRSTSPYSLAIDRAEIFLYFLDRRRWIRPRISDRHPDSPVARLFATLTHKGDGHSMILFGGATVDGTQMKNVIDNSNLPAALSLYEESVDSMKNDVWELTLSGDWALTGAENVTISWKKLKEASKDGPKGRLGHTALVVNNMLVIWGGLYLMHISNKMVECAHEIWVLDLNPDNLKWTPHDPVLSVSGCWNVGNLCQAPAAVLGSTIVTVDLSSNKTSCSHPPLLAVNVTSTKCMLRRHATMSFPFRPEYVFTWNKTILAAKQELGSDINGKGSQNVLNLKYQDKIYTSQMTPGCQKGHFSADWGTKPCERCSIHSFAPSGQPECAACPEGLSTLNTNASSKRDCLCDPNHCKYGQCFIAHTNGRLEAKCECNFGFTGARCQYATYFIIAGVSLASLIIFVLLLVFVRQMIKYKNQKTAKEWELEEMSRVWTIKRSEVSLMERIDNGEPGSYGDVYKARYRDMVVALKKLKLQTREFEREFQREIQLMKSMRHENIVLFLGAGTFKQDDCPFLVMEYMENGALASVLRNGEIPLTREREISFCLDVAKGMEFLHSQRPPRIHRDLKSSNLLVSALWVVKIADFGCARLVKSLGATQSVNKRKFKSSDFPQSATEPLLRAENALSDSVGSALWRAPEIFSGKAYGTLVDVYSFGVVMWEIASRDLPYRDRGYRWIRDVKEAVLSGIRPTLPDGLLESYRDLMSDCWAADPCSRPTFTEAIHRLRQMNLVD
jgi:hypothetical protein